MNTNHRNLIAILFPEHEEWDNVHVWKVKVPNVESTSIIFHYYPESNKYSFLFSAMTRGDTTPQYRYQSEFFISDIRACLLDLFAKHMDCESRRLSDIYRYYDSRTDYTEDTRLALKERAGQSSYEATRAFNSFILDLIDRVRAQEGIADVN